MDPARWRSEGVLEFVKRMRHARDLPASELAAYEKPLHRSVVNHTWLRLKGQRTMLDYGLTAPAMFSGLILFMLVGFPVAFSLGGPRSFLRMVAIEIGYFTVSFLQALPFRIFGIMTERPAARDPILHLHGRDPRAVRSRGRPPRRHGAAVRPIPGGLAYAVIFVGAVLGAITGTVAASVIAMGMISSFGDDEIRLRHADRDGSDRGLRHYHAADPAIAGPRRPGRSARRRSATCISGPLGPRCSRSSLFVVFIAGVSILRPHAVPALPEEARTLEGWALARKVLSRMVPSIILIFLVLGTIFMGWPLPPRPGLWEPSERWCWP